MAVASAFTSSFACEDTASATATGIGADSGSDTLERGVAALGIKEEFLDGVNGAEVGTIREGGLIAGSCAGGIGWACGSSNPGGMVGVEDREPPTWKWSKRRGPKSSAVLSATNASTDNVASSRDGRPWSSAFQ